MKIVVQKCFKTANFGFIFVQKCTRKSAILKESSHYGELAAGHVAIRQLYSAANHFHHQPDTCTDVASSTSVKRAFGQEFDVAPSQWAPVGHSGAGRYASHRGQFGTTPPG